MNIVDLVEQIKHTECQSTYNVCNILKGVSDDPMWLLNRKKVAAYSPDSILGMYFNNSLIERIDTAGYNPGVLKLVIDRYIAKNKPKLPQHNECCVYLRLGDVVHDPNRMDPTQFDYVGQIKNHPHEVITLVSNISFRSDMRDKPEWNMTSERLHINKMKATEVLQTIHDSYPESTLQVYSNTDPDLDICYLYQNGFVGHHDSSWKQVFGNL